MVQIRVEVVSARATNLVQNLLIILYMKIIRVEVLRFPPAALIIDVDPKDSQVEIGR